MQQNTSNTPQPNPQQRFHMPPGKIALLAIGGIAIAIITIIVLIFATNAMRQKSESEIPVVAVDSDDQIKDTQLDEHGNIPAATKNSIYAKVNELSASGSKEERISKVHSYFYSLIQDALDNDNVDFAMQLLFSEYDYFVSIGEQDAALGALLAFDTSKADERQRDNVNRMISETAARLGKNDLAKEYAAKVKNN